MIRYALIDKDDNAYNLDDNTFRRLSDSSSIEADTIERSFRPGADFPGIQRDQSKSMTFEYEINKADEQAFRLQENTYRYQFRKTLKIRDVINDMEIDAIMEEHELSYDDGGFNHGGKMQVTFKFLKPFWQDVDFTEVSDTGFSSGTIICNNLGYSDVPFIATITASEAVTKFSLRCQETGEGILIRDLQFGASGLTTYIIDTSDGSEELNSLLRNDQIKAGTGFFNLQVGTNTIEVSSNGSISIVIQWKRRYYI